MDQQKRDDSVAGLEQSTEAGKREPWDLDHSSFDEDEEENMVTAKPATRNVVSLKRRKKKRTKGKKKKFEDYKNRLEIISLIMFMCGALGLITISALRFTVVET